LVVLLPYLTVRPCAGTYSFAACMVPSSSSDCTSELLAVAVACTSSSAAHPSVAVLRLPRPVVQPAFASSASFAAGRHHPSSSSFAAAAEPPQPGIPLPS
jgi:hypothetical protein